MKALNLSEMGSCRPDRAGPLDPNVPISVNSWRRVRNFGERGVLMDGSRYTLLVSGVVRWPLLDSGRAGRVEAVFPSNLVRSLDSCELRRV